MLTPPHVTQNLLTYYYQEGKCSLIPGAAILFCPLRHLLQRRQGCSSASSWSSAIHRFQGKASKREVCYTGCASTYTRWATSSTSTTSVPSWSSFTGPLTGESSSQTWQSSSPVGSWAHRWSGWGSCKCHTASPFLLHAVSDPSYPRSHTLIQVWYPAAATSFFNQPLQCFFTKLFFVWWWNSPCDDIWPIQTLTALSSLQRMWAQGGPPEGFWSSSM